MNKNRKLTILLTGVLGVMLICFTLILVFMDNNKNSLNKRNSLVQMHARQEASSASSESGTEEILTMDLDEVSFEVVSYLDIDEEQEDSAIREVEMEYDFIDTVELLPSVWQSREMIDRADVDQSGFYKAYATDDLTRVRFAYLDDDGNEKEASLVYPSHIFLYNSDNPDSSSYTIEVAVNDEDNMIQKIHWYAYDSSHLTLSKSSGEKTVVSRSENHVGEDTIGLMITYANGTKATATREVEISVTVAEVEGDAPLYDLHGTRLYCDRQGLQPATYKDFNSYGHFYGEVKTTGWQQIGEETYYYNRDGYPVTGKQMIGNKLYTFDGEGVLTSNMTGTLGIDVSKWQKRIDWETVAASGISFAITRCGYRGSVGAQLVEDPCFAYNITEAHRNGIKVGLYFFTQAVNEREAIEEAKMCVELARTYGVDLPIYIDSERATRGRANNLDKATRTRTLKAFCQAVESEGYEAGVYASKCWFFDELYVEELEMYHIWCAQYNDTCTYTRKKEMWQYSSKGQVPGIDGWVDMNLMY